ncbi:Uncharacterised protein [Klebsiella pneumoniae subsp. ozaenae]|uniref:Uncharacterized protein n=2 Tax=Klebsiella pneumoniae TaxID=573 RepID=A0A377ZBH9_KLEPO|nr:Uncharacterised protein [Klebsiella pneumoniae subsp. ozaenae]
MAEYIALLIRQDDARVRGRIKSISKRRCGKCGDALDDVDVKGVLTFLVNRADWQREDDIPIM